jgi:endonuclease/exonuclease/phosphatase (EEP) superfamily protein YafD
MQAFRRWSWLRAAAIAGFAAAAATACARSPSRTARTPGPAPSIRVMTYNVNFGIPGDPPTIAALTAGRADVVFLQETTPAWERALRAAVGAAYPHALFKYRGAASGLGVLSRLAVRSADLLRPEGEGWFPAWRLVLDAPFGPLQVLVVHLRPPVSDGGSFVSGHFTTPKIREQEIAAFTRALAPDLPTLVVGDFNEEEDGRAIGFLAGLGMRSALPEFAPKQHTWRWPTIVGTLERRLDHIVYDKRLEPLAVEVIEAGRSDHFPVVGVFTLAAAERPR